MTPPEMSLPDWLRRLETLSPNEIDLGLERVSAVLGRLGQGKSPGSAVRLGFAKIDFAALDRDLAAHLEGLRRR